jgi:hypothetical protein
MTEDLSACNPNEHGHTNRPSTSDVILSNKYSITLKFTCLASRNYFHLTNIYGPSSAIEKAFFINWLYIFDTSSIDDWILVRDFNLISSPDNMNRMCGNVADILLFNDLIQYLDLVGIIFKVEATLGVICYWTHVDGC